MHCAPSRKRRTAFIAVLALLLAQALGLAHGIAHPDAQALAFVAASHAGHAHAGAHGEQAHDEGSPQCRLIDQLTHADLLVAPPPVALPEVSPAPPSTLAVWPAPALEAARACARGPPTLLA
jgi:hypothetical protein